MRSAVEWIAVIGGAVVVALVVKTFLFQAFYIPSPSMSPTLVQNDRVLVNKLAYHFHDVHRGDVVVFERPPTEPSEEIKDLIKRVIALPGERVSIIGGPGHRQRAPARRAVRARPADDLLAAADSARCRASTPRRVCSSRRARSS